MIEGTELNWRRGAGEYVRRACKSCGKRIPRWTDGRPTPKSKLFCSVSCGAFHRRIHPSKRAGGAPGKGVAASAISGPIPSALLERVSAVEGRQKYEPCWACGRMQPVVPDQPTYCPPVNGEHRCRDYVPHGPRKVDGQWFIVADPVDYCHGCGLAITPGAHAPRNTAASASFIMPYRIEGHLYCNRTCVPSKRRSLKIKEGASL